MLELAVPRRGRSSKTRSEDAKFTRLRDRKQQGCALCFESEREGAEARGTRCRGAVWVLAWVRLLALQSLGSG